MPSAERPWCTQAPALLSTHWRYMQCHAPWETPEADAMGDVRTACTLLWEMTGRRPNAIVMCFSDLQKVYTSRDRAFDSHPVGMPREHLFSFDGDDIKIWVDQSRYVTQGDDLVGRYALQGQVFVLRTDTAEVKAELEGHYTLKQPAGICIKVA